MGVPATKIEFERELQSRKKERESIQAKLDFEELTRRYKDIKNGKDSLIDEDEFWDSVR
jgi:parvulin-like peptidyl-prolyl isomerase